MKKLTHPQLTKTLVQFKDGSAYRKRWLFFRHILPLEVDYLSHSFWRKETSKKAIHLQRRKK